MRAQTSCLIWVCSRNGFILAIFLSLWNEESFNWLIWFEKFNLESILNPRFLAVETNRMQTSGMMKVPCIVILDKNCSLPIMITSVFPGLSWRKWEFIQSLMAWKHLGRSSTRVWYSSSKLKFLNSWWSSANPKMLKPESLIIYV